MIEACNINPSLGTEMFRARVKAGRTTIRDQATIDRSQWCAERFGSIGYVWDRVWVIRQPRTNDHMMDHDCYFLFTTYENAFEFTMRWGSNVQKPNY